MVAWKMAAAGVLGLGLLVGRAATLILLAQLLSSTTILTEQSGARETMTKTWGTMTKTGRNGNFFKTLNGRRCHLTKKNRDSRKHKP